MPDKNKSRACESQEVQITEADLPLSCPLPRLRVWDAHPKVYLAIEETDNGQKSCPYCGVTYILKHGEVVT